MTNPNPFLPKGSLLEQQSQRRSRLKLAVFCVLSVSVVGLVAMLIQGCKRETPPADAGFPVDTNLPPFIDQTNTPSVPDTNNAAFLPPPMTNLPPVLPPAVEPVAPVGTEYVVVQGDTLGKIAKAHGVTLKALEAANPGVDSKRLKLKQKLVIPAAAPKADASVAAPASVTAAAETYTVKSGDTLTTIAKKHGTTVKALQAANNLTTTKIKVSQKLKLPAKAEVAAPTQPVVDPAPALLSPTLSAPAPATTPVK